MPSSLAHAPAANHDKPFARRMAKAAIDCKTEETQDEISEDDLSASLLLDVLDHFHVAPKQACDWMRIDRSKFTRFGTGEAKPTLAEVMRLPNDIWSELRERINAAKGIESETVDDEEAARIADLVEVLVKRGFRARAVGSKS